MHPEVRQDHPGTCPKCGMALEPEMPSLDEDENPELVDFRRRFWWTLPLTVVVTVLAMFGHRLQLVRHGDAELGRAGALAADRRCGRAGRSSCAASQSVVNRSPNMWTLIGLGTARGVRLQRGRHGRAGVFPASFVSMGRVGVYFEAAAVIISLTLLGQMLELKARSQTSAAIKSLLGLAPKTARRINADGTEEDVPLDPRARRRPAARAPGREGAGRRRRGRRQQRGRRIDAHRRADAGDQARRRQADRRDPEHQRRAGDALRARRLDRPCSRRSCRWSRRRSARRAPMQRMADQVAGYFVVGVVGIALLTFFGWGFFGPQPSWVYGLINAVAVLIIACPCALGLATPMSIMVATGRAATQGVLFRDAAAIENLRKVDTLIVDKTGTLTEGKPAFDRAVAAPGFTRRRSAAPGRQPRPGQRASAGRRRSCARRASAG